MYYDELLNDESPLATSDKMEAYHLLLKSQVKKALDTAYEARGLGKDPKKEVEIYIAQDVASRTEGLVGPKGVAKRFKELEEQELSKDKIVVRIAKEIAQGKFAEGPHDPEKLADQALRTALSYQTEGITAAPIEGISKVRIKANADGSQFLAVYYSGPIRSAGGTAQGVSVYLADIVRKELKLSEYKASEKEVERMLEEVRVYNKIMHLQLPTSDDEIRHAWRNIPIMIHGDPTESDEVSGYRNIDSMETNRVRGGACLVLNDGLVGRAKKITKRTVKLKLEGWDWLQDIAKGKYTDKRATESADGGNPTEVKPDLSFASDALMGRPTFADATVHGGWRLRYGHARNTGIAGIGIHPGLMAVVSDFLAPGTHVRTERPGKGSIVAPVDTIRPPVVLLNDGQVVEVTSYDYGCQIRDDLDEILFMGDMLVGFGEFVQNNYRLCPAGYNEEWWAQEMMKAGWQPDTDMPEIKFYANLSYNPPTQEEAITLAEQYDVALHPKYTPAWKYLDLDEIGYLHQVIWQGDGLPLDVKPIMEKIFVPHHIADDLVYTDHLHALRVQLPEGATIPLDAANGLEVVQQISDVAVRDSMGTTIGARMGRPEKAKARHMSPRLHGLFPVGTQKGVKKNLAHAIDHKNLIINASKRYCESCDLVQWQSYCKQCHEETELKGRCTNCNRSMTEAPCDNCGSPYVSFTQNYEIDMFSLADEVRGRIGSLNEKAVQLKDEIENPTGVVEVLDKGVLRAKFDLHVFRDGTIRYDATDAPLTHFYPYEIGVSVEKLVEIGYSEDIYGDPLTSNDQLLELKPQDIIVHESSIKHFTDVSKFIDMEMKYIYGMDPYYNVKTREDLVGKLVIGLAPHTSAGVIGRIVGFTRSSLCWAHPFWHASKRRNCDGDEDGIILLLDGFLNFSKEYLPTTRGSKMDTPLVLVATLNPAEVDDEAFNLDRMTHYPLEFYEAADRLDMPFKVVDHIKRAEDTLGTPDQYEGFVFSHSTRNVSEGPLITRYKDSDMGIRDKLHEQLYLADIIRAVDERATALRILERHALPDLMGNLRAFASQKVRCVTCNAKYRRIPLKGECTNKDCRKSNLILTVFPKSVSKYFDVCENLVKNYHLGKYHEDRLAKIKLALDSHFQPDKDPNELQLDLTEWF